MTPATSSESPSSLETPGGLDLRALMSVRGLELRARAIVEGFRTGLHRSPHHGFSVEFTEYRQYVPGDDPRHLDWRVYARSDRYFIRKHEDETNLRCHLLVDRSPSMEYASGATGWTKAQYAATLAATLAWFLHSQGDAAGLLTFDSEVRDWLPARHRPGHLRQLMLLLEKPATPPASATRLEPPLERVLEMVRKRGLVILISDFLAPLEELDRGLAALGACGHEVTLFQILDPAEKDFSFTTASIFEDVENGRSLFIDPAAARSQYLERFGQHQEFLTSSCRKLGLALHTLTTDQPLEFALLDFLQDRVKRGKIVRRAQGS